MHCCVCGTTTTYVEIDKAACNFDPANKALKPFLARRNLIAGNRDGTMVRGRVEGVINQSGVLLSHWGIYSVQEAHFVSIHPQTAS